MTPTQLKMARAALGLGVREVAEFAAVSTNTITRFERGERTYPRTVAALRTALEDAGVDFVPQNGGGPGVRLMLSLPELRDDGTPGILFEFPLTIGDPPDNELTAGLYLRPDALKAIDAETFEASGRLRVFQRHRRRIAAIARATLDRHFEKVAPIPLRVMTVFQIDAEAVRAAGQ